MGYSDLLEYKNMRAWVLFGKELKPLLIKVTFQAWKWHIFLWAFSSLLCYGYEHVQPHLREYNILLVPKESDQAHIIEVQSWTVWLAEYLDCTLKFKDRTGDSLPYRLLRKVTLFQ